MGLFKRRSLLRIHRSQLIGQEFVRLLFFYSVSTCLMVLYASDDLFRVVINQPLLWVGISLFYVLMSVIPQEFVYRHFFFARYQELVPNRTAFVVLNASLFCAAHLMFENLLVLALTFAGGILFALTYQRKRSFLLVSLEHSLYGLWLYTLGLGQMLAFPG